MRVHGVIGNTELIVDFLFDEILGKPGERGALATVLADQIEAP